MRTTGSRLSSLLAVAVMAAAGAGTIPVTPPQARRTVAKQEAVKAGRTGRRFFGGPAKRTPVTQADHDAIHLAEHKRRRKGAKFAQDQARSAAGHRYQEHAQ